MKTCCKAKLVRFLRFDHLHSELPLIMEHLWINVTCSLNYFIWIKKRGLWTSCKNDSKSAFFERILKCHQHLRYCLLPHWIEVWQYLFWQLSQETDFYRCDQEPCRFLLSWTHSKGLQKSRRSFLVLNFLERSLSHSWCCLGHFRKQGGDLLGRCALTYEQLSGTFFHERRYFLCYIHAL